jgi:hypothetical protein
MVEFALQSARAVMTGHGGTICCSFFKNFYLKLSHEMDLALGEIYG